MIGITFNVMLYFDDLQNRDGVLNKVDKNEIPKEEKKKK